MSDSRGQRSERTRISWLREAVRDRESREVREIGFEEPGVTREDERPRDGESSLSREPVSQRSERWRKLGFQGLRLGVWRFDLWLLF